MRRKSYKGALRFHLGAGGVDSARSTMHGEEGLWVMRKSREGAPRLHLLGKGVSAPKWGTIGMMMKA